MSGPRVMGDLWHLSPRLWQCDAATAERVCLPYADAAWQRLGIDSVLYVGHGKRLPYATELRVLSLPIGDNDHVPFGVCDLAVEFHRRSEIMLVHCNAGINRSIAFAALLLLTSGAQPTLQTAIAQVERGPAYPTEPLRESLRAYVRARGWSEA